MLKYFIKGCFIGIANIIPGVSGGTMALMLGIYERLLHILSQINVKTVVELASCFKSPDRSGALRRWLVKYDFLFVSGIGLGAVIALVAASKIITYLIVNWHDPTYGFFWGLVAVSVLVPLRMVRKIAPRLAVPALLAGGLTLALSLSMSGPEKLSSAQKKHEMKLAKLEGVDTGEYIPDHRPGHLAQLFGSGAVAISAMILPGISGSFVLLVLGVYFEILEAISAMDFLVIGVVALGCLIGLLAFTRLLNLLLHRYHDETVAALVGLMIGSLYGLWPFQDYAMVGHKRIDLGPILPEFGLGLIGSLVSAAVGGLLVFVFLRWEASSAGSEADKGRAQG